VLAELFLQKLVTFFFELFLQKLVTFFFKITTIFLEVQILVRFLASCGRFARNFTIRRQHGTHGGMDEKEIVGV